MVNYMPWGLFLGKTWCGSTGLVALWLAHLLLRLFKKRNAAVSVSKELYILFFIYIKMSYFLYPISRLAVTGGARQLDQAASLLVCAEPGLT